MAMERVAVIGAGTAGRSFALRCAQAGFVVTLEDVMPEKLRRAQDVFGELPVRCVSTVEDAVHDADLAIDFVPDELESKLEIFSMLDRMAPPRTVLLTPTNALSITDLASCTYRAERCVGLRGDLLAGDVTLVRSRFVAADVLQDVVAFWGKVGLAVEVVEDLEPQLVKNSSS
jgi:3-hydroxybutyryl-CoA dehydrogenase